MTEKPTPPDVAQYVIDPLQKQDSEDLRALAEYCEQLAAWKDRPVDPDEIEGEVVEEDVDLEDADWDDVDELEDTKGISVVEKKVECGDDCEGCPHGPYRYGVYRDGSGTPKTKYLGKVGEV